MTLSATEKTAVTNYIAATPALATLATQARDVEIAQQLNARTIDGVRHITRYEGLKWAAIGGRYAKLLDAAQLMSNTAAIRSRCWVMLEVCKDGLDARDLGLITLVDALISDGVLNAGDKTAFLTAAADKVSKSFELIKRDITPDEVGVCR